MSGVVAEIGHVFQIRYPEVFAGLLQWLRILDLTPFKLMPLPCLLKSNFHTVLLMSTLVQLVLILCLYAAGAVAFHMEERAKRAGNLKRAAQWQWLGSMLFNGAFIVMFLTYPSSSSTIFSTFPCKELDDGSRWLRADLTIDCASDAHTRMVVYAAVMVLVIPLGAPALYGYLLFKRHGKTLNAIKDIDIQRTKLEEQAKAEDEYKRWERGLVVDVAPRVE